MNKSVNILFVCLIVTVVSCSERMAVFVKVLGLNSNTEKLEIEFDFKNFIKDESVNVANIEIYMHDSLIYELESETKTITQWKFPELPEGFRMKYPENRDIISTFKKTDDLRFEFKGAGNKIAYGSWTYKPVFSTEEYSWLFDDEGNKIINIECYYEPWIGKDIIKIILNEALQFNTESFQLYDQENNTINFVVKAKKEKTNRFALVLKQDLKQGEYLDLVFNIGEGKTYKERIIVPSKTVVGIAGKYRDL